MVESFKLDTSIKYPNLYGKTALQQWQDVIKKKLKYKIENNIIDISKLSEYKIKIKEEFEAMKKQGMESFMLFMSELVDYCADNNIPYAPSRGSVAGSEIAYITNITDVDPVIWNTVFSRFCNADRISIADIDMDFSSEDRKRVYEFIIKKFTPAKTAYIAQFSTLKDRGTIDVLSRGLEYKDLNVVKDIKDKFDDLYKKFLKIIQEEVNLEELDDTDAKSVDFDYIDVYIKQIRNTKAIEKIIELSDRFKQLKKDNKDIFYYFDGLKGTITSKGNHPAGIIGSPITLQDNLGIFYKDGDENFPVCQNAMKAVDSLNYAKFDILGSKTVGIAKDTYDYINSHYLKAHEINWNDEAVWKDMVTSPVGIFQFEGEYAFDMLKNFDPRYINDMSLINAAIRPSGKSYRDKLIRKEFNKNPSKQIDELLKENYGFLCYQEDTIKFLIDICGLSGDTADSVRRYIGKKLTKELSEILPKILEGYCNNSDKPREIAEEEAKQFLKIIDDSSEYQFGYNHSTGYSMEGYIQARLRKYHTIEFITAYLNRSETEEDIAKATILAQERGISINPIKFRYSKDTYWFDKSINAIYKGLSSIKGFGEKSCIGNQLYILKDNKYNSFTDLLNDIYTNTKIGFSNLKVLIKLSYFSEFGNDKKLYSFLEYYDKYINRKTFKKKDIKEEDVLKLLKECCTETEVSLSKFDSSKFFKLIWDIIPEEKTTLYDKIKNESEYYGYIQTIIPKLSSDYAVVTELNTKYWHPSATIYRLNDGTTEKIKINGKNFKNNVFKEFDVIKTIEREEKHKNKYVGKDDNGKNIYEQLDEREWILLKWSIVDLEK